ncbi:chaplin [Streptomyces sp. NPDC052236]|uniref:chaplin n=1 Tax=Streptomyces sp. NPDC052236 TaxID=3365686 RepID=UPI0037D1CFB1
MKRMKAAAAVAGILLAIGSAAPAMASGGDGGEDGASATGFAAGSPGLISGNTIQVPIHIPLQVCGNTIDIIGLLNPAAGNTCAAR